MFQTFLEDESDVNWIVDPAKLGFSFIEIVLTGTKQLLFKGEGTGKW